MDLVDERSSTEMKFLEMVEGVLHESPLELYDLHYLPSQSLLRVFIINPGTKTAVIEDCISVDRALTDPMQEDWVPEDIVLEVSSPGIHRKLRSAQHFEWAKGEYIQATLRSIEFDLADAKEMKKVQRKRQIRGLLEDFNEVEYTLRVGDEQIKVSLDHTKSIVLDPEIGASSNGNY